MGAVTFLVHAALAAFYGYSTYYYVYGVVPPEQLLKIRESNFGLFKYLTFWDLLLQLFFFSLCTFNYLLCGSGNKWKKSSIDKFLDFIFASLIFPCATFVSVSFWGIFLHDRELIFPAIYDAFFPSWLNHAVHSLPTIAVLFELITHNHSFPSQKKGFIFVAFFSSIYLFWVLYIAHTTGHWVYPILAKLNNVGRGGFIAAMAVLMGIFYILGDILQTLRWGKQESYEELIYHKRK